MASPFIKGIICLDQNSGARIHAKYFSPDLSRDPEKQLAFEKKLHAKTSTTALETEVLVMENHLIVYISGMDICFYVFGTTSENELILALVLDAIVETLKSVLRGHLDKNTILDNLELLLLTVDEVIDCGSILETDSTVLSKRVMLRNPDGSPSVPNVAAAVGELTLSSAFNAARDQLVRLSRA